ncbi:Hypothetical protein FKW44_021535, partial [Caligus rogercresseyi]
KKKATLEEAELEKSEESMKNLSHSSAELEHFEVLMSQEFEEQFIAYNRPITRPFTPTRPFT